MIVQIRSSDPLAMTRQQKNIWTAAGDGDLDRVRVSISQHTHTHTYPHSQSLLGTPTTMQVLPFNLSYNRWPKILHLALSPNMPDHFTYTPMYHSTSSCTHTLIFLTQACSCFLWSHPCPRSFNIPRSAIPHRFPIQSNHPYFFKVAMSTSPIVTAIPLYTQ